MSRKPATHKADSERHHLIVLRAAPSGGFALSKLVREPIMGHEQIMGQVQRNVAVFSTLDEALEWLRVNMARPVNDPKPEVTR